MIDSLRTARAHAEALNISGTMINPMVLEPPERRTNLNTQAMLGLYTTAGFAKDGGGRLKSSTMTTIKLCVYYMPYQMCATSIPNRIVCVLHGHQHIMCLLHAH